jgi:hypothetical protein
MKTSIARTRKMWTPGARSVYCCPLGSQEENGSSSSAHSNSSTPAPVAENMNVAVASVDGLDGAISIVVSGASLCGQYVHRYVAGVGSALSDASTARTSK